ncbi:unnamed protein product [Brassica oleracea var. botrytis]|uniref:Retrotransposon Copia-like N-terminal domain-containing protein n=1 Tax=Brassica oleracea TaxID=3712 RepID=A0A3P6G5T1_BRAOL|nr:unnamed protein product [Brassica oleracea]
MINIKKLSSTKFITWSAQIKSLLRGYDLLMYINSTTAIPLPTAVSQTGSSEPILSHGEA